MSMLSTIQLTALIVWLMPAVFIATRKGLRNRSLWLAFVVLTGPIGLAVFLIWGPDCSRSSLR